MSKHIAYVSLEQVERIELRVSRCTETLQAVQAATGADYILNGGMWNADGSACPLLKVDGKLVSAVPWGAYGYGWDQGPDLRLTSGMDRRNFIACTCLIGPWGPVEKPSYDPAGQGGRRGRSAMGLRRGCLCLYCAGDGTADASTPEQLRDELSALGWESAVMLDGGGSSQCDLNGAVIRASRRVHNWICVYLKHEAARPPEQEEKPMGKPIVCLDPGHGPTTVNGSPDGSYKEQEFAWDMYERIAPILEGRGVAVVVTRDAHTKPSLTDRAAVSNEAGAACLVSLHSNAFGSGGWTSAQGLEIYTSAGPETAARNVLAADLVARFRAAGVKIRQEPVKHDINLTVLIKASAPACLIEYGYHTNEGDVSLLKSDTYRDKLARATADGICDFLGVAVEEAPGVPAAPEEKEEDTMELYHWFADMPDWARASAEKAYKKGLLAEDPQSHAVSVYASNLQALVWLDRLGLLD